MSKSSHSRSKSASDVRRTLFRSLSRSGAPPSSSSTNLASNIPSTSSGVPSSGLGDDDEARIASEGIVVRNKDGSMDLEVPLTTSQHAQLLDGIERESEQQRAAAELVKRHQVDINKRLPELLRLQVLSLSQDNWMFESDEEY